MRAPCPNRQSGRFGPMAACRCPKVAFVALEQVFVRSHEYLIGGLPLASLIGFRIQLKRGLGQSMPWGESRYSHRGLSTPSPAPNAGRARTASNAIVGTHSQSIVTITFPILSVYRSSGICIPDARSRDIRPRQPTARISQHWWLVLGGTYSFQADSRS